MSVSSLIFHSPNAHILLMPHTKMATIQCTHQEISPHAARPPSPAAHLGFACQGAATGLHNHLLTFMPSSKGHELAQPGSTIECLLGHPNNQIFGRFCQVNQDTHGPEFALLTSTYSFTSKICCSCYKRPTQDTRYNTTRELSI